MRPDKQRYLYHLVEDSNLRFWLNNDQWLEYDAEDLSEFMVKNATAGIVTYPSGEILWGFGQLRQLPSEVHLMLGPVFRDSTPGYRSKNVRNGKGGASIIHGVSRSQKGDPRFNYSTTIKNDTDQKIRVTKFAPFLKGLLGIKKEPGEGYYTALQFREWFRVSNTDGWIEPDTSVCDPDNYGSGKGLWIYFFECEDGSSFISTAPLISE